MRQKKGEKKFWKVKIASGFGIQLLSHLFFSSTFQHIPVVHAMDFVNFRFSVMTAMLGREEENLNISANNTTNAIISVAEPLRKCVTD